jgi:hypothetical protein
MNAIAAFPPKKDSFWLILLLALASILAVPQAQGGPRLVTQGVKTEWLITARRQRKSAVHFFVSNPDTRFSKLKWPTDDFISQLFQVQWRQRIKVFLTVKPSRRQTDYFWLPRVSTISIPS